MSASSNSRIPTLDGWRAVAISAVIALHVGNSLYSRQSAAESDPTRFGAFGVDIFFGLSGLLITTLLLQQWRKTSDFDLRGFYIRRAFRILPPYFAYLAVCTVLGRWHSAWEVAGSLLFFRNYVPMHLAGSDTQHLWSLSLEEHFYLLWPSLLCLLGPRRARPAAAMLAISFGLWRMVESQLASPTLPMLLSHNRTDLRLDALLWGAVFAFLLHDFLIHDSSRRAKLTAQLRWPVWLILSACWALCVYYYSQLTSIWVAAGVPILLLGTVVNPDWPLSRFLEWAPVAWLGRISYSLYLWQGLYLVPGWVSQGQPYEWLRPWPVGVAASLLTATASYLFIEKPCIRIGRRLAERLPSAPVQSPLVAGDLGRKPVGTEPASVEPDAERVAG